MKHILITAIICLCCSMAFSQQVWDSTGVDMSDYWNIDGWMYNDDADVPDAYCLDGGSPGAQRVRVETLPEGLEAGAMNWTEDQTVQFLLPDFQENALDAYLPDGSVIDVPNGQYERIFMALMSGNGAWPGGEDDWAGSQDNPRHEVNSFKPIYTDGEGDWTPIGLVNDWFWTPPEWVAPVSGDPDEVIADWLTYDGDWDDPLYFWDAIGLENHDYSQTHRINGVDNFLLYQIPMDGATSANLYIVMWGNIDLQISTDDQNYETLYNTVEENGEPYFGRTGNMDGYEPNRKIYEFDLDPYLADAPPFLYLQFKDAAPNLAEIDPEKAVEGVDNWGPRVHHIGIFTGEVKKTRLGERLWPGLVREGNDAPQGGLILIKKSYPIDSSKTLDKIQMPDNFSDDNPRSDPYLTVFGITLANKAEVSPVLDFMLY